VADRVATTRIEDALAAEVKRRQAGLPFEGLTCIIAVQI
jgi:hypothetical protein